MSKLKLTSLAVVVLVGLVAIGVAMAAGTKTAVAPTNSSAPSVAGSAAVGATLTANPGTWNGSSPLSFQYQWQICGSNGSSCHDIAGATTQTYTVKSADLGNTIRVQVIASNADGSSTATSGTTAVIAAAKGPTETAPPTVSGTAAVGSTLTASPGTWTGTGTIAYTYVWQVCGNDGNACHAIANATSQTYVVQATDQGNTIRVQVTATDSNASTAATSAATAVVTAATTTPGGCAANAQPVAVTDVSPPNRLLIASAVSSTGVIGPNMQSIVLKVRVTDTACRPVSGAQVYGTAVPYNQVSIPPLGTTDASGLVTLTFNRMVGFPASRNQQLMAMFLRATKPGDSLLAGVSTRRLIGLKVNLHP